MQGQIIAVGDTIDGHYQSGANLFAMTQSVLGYVGDDGSVSADADTYGYRCSDYIAVLSGEILTYQSWVNRAETVALWYFYDSQKNKIGGRYIGRISGKWAGFGLYRSQISTTVPINAAYIRISSRWLQTERHYCKLEVGPATPWRPAPADLDEHCILLDRDSDLVVSHILLRGIDDEAVSHPISMRAGTFLRLATPATGAQTWQAPPQQRLLLKSLALKLTPPRHAVPHQLLLGGIAINADIFSGGAGYIAGTGTGIVTVAGQPAIRRVVAIRRDNLRVVRGVWSKSDGSYRLPDLNPDLDYIVMALDHERQYEPAAWDWVRPAVDDPADITSPPTTDPP